MKNLLALVFAGVLTTTAAAEPALHVKIVETITDIAAGADRDDWGRVRSAMSDEITTDYTSLFGGEPVSQPADDLVKSWAAFLPGFDSTHHMVTNHTVTSAGADRATAEADFTATHRIGDALWVLGGRYSYRLDKSDSRWLVTSMTMQALWETGDRAALVSQALERITAKK
ncbi:MAG: nuclear transport factor 2 family protein [Defluviicoccus sp.]|nr:nuclear transport factor 2 family protein [Defluviicoccus sp.]MDE0383631.1 nuclear transport factor 2 family protein [Defluviicoccus sp.]